MPFIDLNSTAKPITPVANSGANDSPSSSASTVVTDLNPNPTAPAPVVQAESQSEKTATMPSPEPVISPAPIPPMVTNTTSMQPNMDVNINPEGVKEVRGPQFATPKQETDLTTLANPQLDEKLAKLPVMDNSVVEPETEPAQPQEVSQPIEQTTTTNLAPATSDMSAATPAPQSAEAAKAGDMKADAGNTAPSGLPGDSEEVETDGAPKEREITFGVENDPQATAVQPTVSDDKAVAAPQAETNANPPAATPAAESVPDPKLQLGTDTMQQPEVMPEAPTPLSDAADSMPPVETHSAQPSVPVNTGESTLPAADQPQATPGQENSNDLSIRSYSLADLLKQAVELNASDLHIVSGRRAMARVDGTLKPIQSAVLDDETIYAMLADIVKDRANQNDIHQIRDLDLAYSLADQKARFRVNIFKQSGHPGAVFRLISDNIRTIEQLKLPVILKDFTKFGQGLVLVTGASGSGKSTTIASILNEINLRVPCHIVTIEDPIEYVYPQGLAVVDQRSVYDDTDSWHDALRSVLRQDPDVVLVGEMRDLETISAALTVAETGHLVFATLHTNGAAQSIDRIIDVFPEAQQNQVRTQLASVLMAVVSQKLLPVNGGGRRVAAELMIASPAVRNAIRETKVYQIDNMIQTGADVGMITMEKSLVGLIREGVISVEEAEQYANNPEDLMTMLGIRH